MPLSPKRRSASIVLVGSFNPAIFHPAWLAMHELVRKGEAEEPKIEISHPNVSVFEVGDFKLSVTVNKFLAATTAESLFESLRDLVKGIFTLLSHTPITAMGINLDTHYVLEREREWHRIGHTLAPKEHWDMLKDPGMHSLTIQAKRTDSREGYVRVTVESPGPIGALDVKVNDHFELEQNHRGSTQDVLDILGDPWKESIRRAEDITDTIVSLRGS